MSRPLDEPTPADVDAILRFLPLLEQPDFDAGTVDAAHNFGASPVLLELIQALQDHHFVYEFDWSEWRPVAERYEKDPALLGGAGLGTVRKLFTVHLHSERFEQGHLARVTRSGHLLAVLRRLHTLRTTM